jgi:hypothetical protein
MLKAIVGQAASSKSFMYDIPAALHATCCSLETRERMGSALRAGKLRLLPIQSVHWVHAQKARLHVLQGRWYVSS